MLIDLGAEKNLVLEPRIGYQHKNFVGTANVIFGKQDFHYFTSYSDVSCRHPHRAGTSARERPKQTADAVAHLSNRVDLLASDELGALCPPDAGL